MESFPMAAGVAPAAQVAAFRRWARRRRAEQVVAEQSVVWRAVAIQWQLRGEPERAWHWARRSLALARDARCAERVAAAHNTLGGFALDRGRLRLAERHLRAALTELAGDQPLRARVALNLGTVAGIRGRWRQAKRYYGAAQRVARRLGDDALAAMCSQNLARVCLAGADWAGAAAHARDGVAAARRAGDARLEGLCELSLVRAALGEDALLEAAGALQRAVTRLRRARAQFELCDAWLVAGQLTRQAGAPACVLLLQRAARRAARHVLPLTEASAWRELARWHAAREENREALLALASARRAFDATAASAEAREAARQQRELAREFLRVMRAWGRSLELQDPYTFGHSERVARHAVAIARQLGLDVVTRQCIRVGAYLHDIGKLRVPLAVLRKAGALSAEERAQMEAHPAHGVALLQDIPFPWDILPIVGQHHEHVDGSGYPGGRAGEDVPLPAQVVGVADVFDALTSDRPYRAALSVAEALREMRRTAGWWRADVLAAAEAVLGDGARVAAPPVRAPG